MKPCPPAREPLGSVLQRTWAAVLSATVLYLTALAVWPEAHEQLHGASTADANHSCAVTLYAQGVISVLSQVNVPLPLEEWVQTFLLPRDELRLVAARYLLRPLRGPPLS